MSLFTQNCAGNELKGFINSLYTPQTPCFEHREIIHLPKEIGAGTIINLSLEEGISIQYFDFNINDELTYNFSELDNQEDTIYKLVFNLENCGSAVTFQADTISNQHLKNCNAFLFSEDFIREFYIEKKIPVNRLVLSFSASWLERNFSQASDTIHQLIQDLKIKNRPTYISQSLDNKTFIMINELAKKLRRFDFALLQVKTCGLIILNDFLTKIVSHEPTIVNNEEGIHYKTMMMVESRLIKSIETKIPCMNKLALEYNLSASTLKRHFRKVYGKNVAQYYHEKKLIVGKAMLENDHKTICEVARKLGYTKASSFSKAFRKYFGYLPREIRFANLIN